MKAEERHELRENDLASWLQYGLWAFLRQNGSYILLVLALAFLGYRLWALYEVRQENARLTAWNELDRAMTGGEIVDGISRLRGLVDTSPIKDVKAQACLKLGDIYDILLVDPSTLDRMRLSPEEALTKAYEYYQQTLTLQGNDLLVAGKAHLGMASVLEDRGEWDKARAEYQTLTDPSSKFATMALSEVAKQRLATLDERKNAPQLAAANRSRYHDELNKVKLGPASSLPAGLPELPGLFKAPTSPFPTLTPPKPSTPDTPATPATGPGQDVPFLGPTIPGITPIAPATGAAAPQPK